MTTITIDATELHEAAPKIGALYATLGVSARQLRALDVSCEMPPGLAGQVAAGVSGAASDLSGAERTMDGMDSDIRKRAMLAKIADAMGKTSFGTVTIKLPADIIDAARRADEADGKFPRVSKQAGDVAKNIKKVLGVAGLAGDLYDVANIAGNPFLDDNRKASEAVSKGTSVAVPLVVAGAVVGGLAVTAALPVVAIGAGVALTYTVLDKTFHISDKVSDGVNSALDTAADGVDAAGEALEDVGEDIGEGVKDVGEGLDKAKDLVGGLF